MEYWSDGLTFLNKFLRFYYPLLQYSNTPFIQRRIFDIPCGWPARLALPARHAFGLPMADGRSIAGGHKSDAIKGAMISL